MLVADPRKLQEQVGRRAIDILCRYRKLRRLSSLEQLKHYFPVQWLLADLSNFLGAFWQGLLPTIVRYCYGPNIEVSL